MAFVNTLKKKDLALIFDAGLVDGKQRTSARTFLVKDDASDENMYLTAITLSSLVKPVMLEVNARVVEEIQEI